MSDVFLVFGNFLWQHEVGKGLIKKEIPPQRKVFSHKYTVDKIVDFICIISISDRIHSVLCKYLKPGQRILSTARCTLLHVRHCLVIFIS